MNTAVPMPAELSAEIEMLRGREVLGQHEICSIVEHIAIPLLAALGEDTHPLTAFVRNASIKSMQSELEHRARRLETSLSIQGTKWRVIKLLRLLAEMPVYCDTPVAQP